jgi:hypothetical protein
MPRSVSHGFGHFVAIDWSGAKGPRQNGIAIALCQPGMCAPRLVRPGHRWSRQDVLDWLRSDLPGDALVGFDLSPGLPFADCGAFFPGWEHSPGSAKALWRLIDELAADDPHLSVSSVVSHPALRRHFRHGKGDCGDLFTPGAGRMRLTEQRQKAHQLNPTSCFNLVGAAQVGKSSLTGMRVLHRLDGAIPVWPYDPLPASGPAIVEIYTSLAARAAGIPPGRSKMLSGAALDAALGQLGCSDHVALERYTDHATDAILTSAWLRQVAAETDLWSPRGLEPIAQTEGWTFGVR